MDKRHADQKLVEAARKGKWKMVTYWHSRGGRHRELWTLMKHANYLLLVEAADVFENYPQYASVKYSHKGGIKIKLTPYVLRCATNAKQAAIAILGVKNKGLNKDMHVMIAKLIYLNYENRYNRLWDMGREERRILIDKFFYLLLFIMFFYALYSDLWQKGLWQKGFKDVRL